MHKMVGGIFVDYKEILRNLRVDHGYSQEYIADYLGIERKTYNRYESENHTSEIKFKDAIELAKLYNISLDYLAGLTDKIKPLDKNQPIYGKNIVNITNQGGNNKINIKQ